MNAKNVKEGNLKGDYSFTSCILYENIQCTIKYMKGFILYCAFCSIFGNTEELVFKRDLLLFLCI